MTPEIETKVHSWLLLHDDYKQEDLSDVAPAHLAWALWGVRPHGYCGRYLDRLESAVATSTLSKTLATGSSLPSTFSKNGKQRYLTNPGPQQIPMKGQSAVYFATATGFSVAKTRHAALWRQNSKAVPLQTNLPQAGPSKLDLTHSAGQITQRTSDGASEGRSLFTCVGAQSFGVTDCHVSESRPDCGGKFLAVASGAYRTGSSARPNALVGSRRGWGPPPRRSG